MIPATHRFAGPLARPFALLAILLPAILGAAEPATITSPLAAQDWTLTDIAGLPHAPWKNDRTQAVVLVFISTDCPVANYYHPTLRKLQAEFADRGVEWYFIQVDPQLTVARAQQHAQDYSLEAPVVLDPQHALARAAGATKTPQAAVITRDGTVAYLGRIDDTYTGFGKKRAQPTRRDLQTAIAELLADRPVTAPRTESVGCFIPFAK
jgi:peroxiredoxin